MGNERGKIEGHVNPRIRPAKGLAVQIDTERQINLSAIPGCTKLIRRHGRGREC